MPLNRKREFVIEVEGKKGWPHLTMTALDEAGELGSKITIDNTYLVDAGICLFHNIYRLSHRIGRPLRYDATRLNCYVVASYLTTGQVE